MRILLVTPMPPRAEAPGGMPLVLHAQLTGLRRRHEVTLVTGAGDEPGELDAALELPRSSDDVHVVDRRAPRGAARWRRRWRLARTWARGAHPWRTVWFADPGIQETLDALMRTREFDVAAVEDSSMGVFRIPPYLPTVLTEHEVRRPRGIDWRCGAPSNWHRWAFREIDWRRWAAYQQSVWRRFDRIQVFTASDSTAVGVVAPDLLGRVRVTPFGIELPEESDPAREEPGTILFVGDFSHAPNVDAALWLGREIMGLLRGENSRARLIIVGRGAPAEIQALAAPDIDVAGEVPTIAPYLDAAAVVLAPLRIGGGMRVKVLHALAAGKAVVTTPRGAEGFWVAGERPPVLIAEDAAAIADVTSTLLNDTVLRRTLGAQARSFVGTHFSPEAYARRLEAVYEDAAAGKMLRTRAVTTR